MDWAAAAATVHDRWLAEGKVTLPPDDLEDDDELAFWAEVEALIGGVKAGFNPAQSRNAAGQWSTSSSQQDKPAKKKPAKKPAIGRVRAALGAHLHIRDENSAVVRSSLAELERMPLYIAQRIAAAGAEIYLGNVNLTDLDALQFLKKQAPDEATGMTWDDMSGLTYGKVVAVGNNGGDWTVVHEIGHLLGGGIGLASGRTDQPDMAPAWVAIHKKLYRKLVPYLQQNGPGSRYGCLELFAEVFMTIVRNENLARNLYGREAVSYVKAAVA